MERATEELGYLIDMVEIYLPFCRAEWPGTAEEKMALVAYGLQDIRRALFDLYNDLGGEDVWCQEETHFDPR